MDYTCFFQCKNNPYDTRDNRPLCSSMPIERRNDLYCIDPKSICNSYDDIYSSVLVTMSTVVVIFFLFQPFNIVINMSMKRKCELKKAPWLSTACTASCFVFSVLLFAAIAGLAIWSLIIDDHTNVGRRIGGALLSVLISIIMGIVIPIIIIFVSYWCCFAWTKVDHGEKKLQTENEPQTTDAPASPTNEASTTSNAPIIDIP